jgi:hypothetical protein
MINIFKQQFEFFIHSSLIVDMFNMQSGGILNIVATLISFLQPKYNKLEIKPYNRVGMWKNITND